MRCRKYKNESESIENSSSFDFDFQIILLDTRSFVDYNTSHIRQALNIGGTRAFRRKFLANEVPIIIFLAQLTNMKSNMDTLKSTPIILYDQCLDDLLSLRFDCFLYRVLVQTVQQFKPIFLLKGGFLSFQALYPDLCWANAHRLAGEDVAEYHHDDCALEQILDSCLQTVPSPSLLPTCCLPVNREPDECLDFHLDPVGLPSPQKSMTGSTIHSDNMVTTGVPAKATRSGAIKSGSCSLPDSPRPSPILPHLVLGSQLDAMSATTCRQYGITHVINVSVDGAAPTHIPPENFYRVPVNDNHTDRIQPFFAEAFLFIDKVKANQGRALIHCSAGISRSPTLAIAYLMYSCKMPMRKAYDVIKAGRATVAPNFNFLGQLLDFEHELFGLALPPASGHSTYRTDVDLPLSTDPSPTADQSVGAAELTIPIHVSATPVVKRPSFSLKPKDSVSPKHSMTKKRDRPTYLSLDSQPADRALIRSNLPWSSQPVEADISPSEGKRSRVSLLHPFTPRSGNLLPSPCTVFSRLELSSPSEEYRRFLTPSRSTSFIVHSPSDSFQRQTEKPLSGIASVLAVGSSTSLDELCFEPCSAKSAPAGSSRVGSSLRRSLTSVGAYNVRPTLLAERSFSSQLRAQSDLLEAVSSQSKASVITTSTLLPSGSSVLSNPRPSTSFVHDLSPVRRGSSSEQEVEMESCLKFFVPASRDTSLPQPWKQRLHSDSDPTGQCYPPITHKKCLHSITRPSHLSLSAPTPSLIVSRSTDRRRSALSPAQLRTSASMGSELARASHSPESLRSTSTSPAKDETSFCPIPFESCRQQQQQLFYQSSSNSSSSMSSSSAGHNSAHSGSFLNVYSVS
ncbi:hypothetical protein P879_02652 [Paragonimus westermani]|uniref:protein-tyrosine-phosphatase n=1 Tax=Paragonimus westermani TaxID=34504 RepID=A0A8T0CYL5_9TREM|nr:hypothetical protein P879_02652 [Paragonimus westermani]